MTRIGMAEQSQAVREQFESETIRTVKMASDRGLTLRVLGSLAFHLQCPQYGHLQQMLGRAYTDIDFAGYSSESQQVGLFFAGLGYREDPEVNLYYAGQRMIFYHPSAGGLHVDVFFDRLDFCHQINWVGRLNGEPLTLPLAEMLMEKMQIVKINEKDLVDTIILLLEHRLGDDDNHAINIRLISELCARDWGLWRTLTMNLDKVTRRASGYPELSVAEKARVAAQVDSALERINREPKSLGWKLRARLGERVKWYREVDEVA